MQAPSLAHQVKMSKVNFYLTRAALDADQQNMLPCSPQYAITRFVALIRKKGGVYVSAQTAQREQKPSCSFGCGDP
jgi:hypothetical protein